MLSGSNNGAELLATDSGVHKLTLAGSSVKISAELCNICNGVSVLTTTIEGDKNTTIFGGLEGLDGGRSEGVNHNKKSDLAVVESF